MDFLLLQRMLYLSIVCSVLQASVVRFSAAPAVLKANLTETAALRCSLADTGGQIGKRDVTNTSDDILHISSIVITRNDDKHVATVTAFDPPTALVDQGNLQAKGDVSGLSSEGYLQLTWQDASRAPTGQYTCEVNAIDRRGHTVVFSKTLELEVEAPTLGDVIGHFKDTISQLKTQVAGQAARLTACTAPRAAFMATVTDSTTVTAHGHDATVVFDHELTDEDGGYDASTGRFTCTTPGLYFFSASAVADYGNDFCFWIKHNDQVVTSLYARDKDSVEQGSTSAVLHLLANDVVQVASSHVCDAGLFHDHNIVNGNVFTGHLIRSDGCTA